MANRFPFVGSGRLQEGGALATRKQDFNAHWEGNGFRHGADNIDMNPVLPSVGGITVQETLENLHNLIVSAGTGFLSIGSLDGYIQGDYNVGAPSTPTLKDAFDAAFSDIRLTDGGVILLLTGRYHLRATVTIPPGVSVIGEMAGTIIVGEMQETPMFVISKPNSSVDLVTGVTFEVGSNIDVVRFSNLTLADNLDGYMLFGEPTMATVPMIQAQISSNFVCENVSFIGRIHSGSVPRSKTLSAINYTGSGTTGTSLKLKNCYLDGLRSGVSFTPGNNEKDFLTIEGCKARIYGTEDVAAQGISLNSFLVTTHCNLTIINNYFVGAGTYANTFINISSGSGTNTKSVISGNTGKPNTLSSGRFINDASGSAYVAAVSNNNWGTAIDSTWYIVVGGGSGTSSVGDFNGVGAIDTILSIANSISSFTATVIVNPGTYTVTGSAGGNFANLRFIGNKHGKNYPVFSLALTSSTLDSLGNRVLALGNYLQSIQFVSSTVKHSIRPGFNPSSITLQSPAHTLEVIDCNFINTSLYALDLATSSWVDEAGHAASTKIKVSYCYFLQDGAFSNTVSMLLPVADEVKVENCYFTGNGYALSIGVNGYTPSHGSGVGNILLSNIICDLTGFTIANTVGGLGKSYVLVDAGSFLKVDNCQFYTSTSYQSVSPINPVLVAIFSKFIQLKATNINIEDSLFVGPFQTFTLISTSYAIPTLFLEPINSARVRNCKFLAGSLPLQFGGTVLSDGDFRESIVVENCYFKGASQTLIDLDLDTSSEDPFAQVIIKGCNFTNSTGVQRILHTNTSSTYSGAVQLFAGDCFVSFTDNLMQANLTALAGSSNYAGLVIENTGSQGNTATISGNTFYVSNSFTSASSSASSACVMCRSSVSLIQNNTLSLYNTASPSSSFIGPLWIDNPSVGTFSDSIVSGNIFARRNYFGTTGNLVRGYIHIASTSSSNRGRIVDNSFDSTTFNGSSTALVEDNTTVPNIWTIERNKNQTVSYVMMFSSGNKAIGAGADLGNQVLYGGIVSSSAIYGSTGVVTFSYKNTGSQNQFRWFLPLHNILPPNVIITGVSYKYQASAVPATSGTVNASIDGFYGVDNDNNTIVGTSTVSRTMSLTNDYTTGPTDSVNLMITAAINHSSNMTVAITEVFITYHW